MIKKLLLKYFRYILPQLSRDELALLQLELQRAKHYRNPGKIWENGPWATWDTYLPPHRPCESDIAIWRNAIATKEVTDGHFLILGATPELRDLASEFGIVPLILDLSISMIWGMLFYTKRVDLDREIWVKGDWLTAPLPKQYFTHIWGDLVLHHIPLGLQNGFLERISNLLTPRGTFITRFHIINKSLLAKSYEDIFNEYRDTNFLNKDRRGEAMNLLASQLYDRSTSDDHMIDPERIAQEIGGYIKYRRPNPSFRRFLEDFLKLHIRSIRKRWVSQTKEEVDRLLLRHFKIINQQAVNPHYPLYTLMSKY